METILTYSADSGLARELVSAGRLLGTVKALALDEAAAGELAACGTDVLRYDGTGIIPADTAAVAQVIALAAEKAGASVVLLGSDRRGKELAGRLAMLLDAGCLTDVKTLSLEGGSINCTRLSFGGATISAECITSPVKIIAISPANFNRAEPAETGSIEGFDGAVAASVTLISARAKESEGVDLKAAEVIVAVGEGVSEENIKVADKLAAALGGVLACSKPIATDRHFLSEERVIGLSGVICKPELALVIGISGQAQFTVGVRDAKTIISINTDKNAPINYMADYYLVKDSGAAIAELCEKLA